MCSAADLAATQLYATPLGQGAGLSGAPASTTAPGSLAGQKRKLEPEDPADSRPALASVSSPTLPAHHAQAQAQVGSPASNRPARPHPGLPSWRPLSCGYFVGSAGVHGNSEADQCVVLPVSLAEIREQALSEQVLPPRVKPACASLGRVTGSPCLSEQPCLACLHAR